MVHNEKKYYIRENNPSSEMNSNDFLTSNQKASIIANSTKYYPKEMQTFFDEPNGFGSCLKS